MAKSHSRDLVTPRGFRAVHAARESIVSPTCNLAMLHRYDRDRQTCCRRVRPWPRLSREPHTPRSPSSHPWRDARECIAAMEPNVLAITWPTGKFVGSISGASLSYIRPRVQLEPMPHVTLTPLSRSIHKKNPYIRIMHLINRWRRLITVGSVGLTKGDRKCFVNYSLRRTALQRRS